MTYRKVRTRPHSSGRLIATCGRARSRMMPARRMTPRPSPERRKAPASPRGAGASPASKHEADAA
jgi:hypothetical protein